MKQVCMYNPCSYVSKVSKCREIRCVLESQLSIMREDEGKRVCGMFVYEKGNSERILLLIRKQSERNVGK
jgi:hypothetical protein